MNKNEADKNSGPLDFAQITQRQQETWSSGDFHEVARQNVIMAEALCEATNPHATNKILDVACGSGTAALVAARRYCEVTGIDYVPRLVKKARAIAAASGLEVDFQVADAQDLPFDDNSFDMVFSVYGVQFAPNQEKAAKEMLRVCRSGGKIALASPVAEGWSGDFFAVNSRYMPPPHGIKSPLIWGTAQGINELLGSGMYSTTNEERTAHQYYRSVDHAVNVFLNYFGPTIQASESLEKSTKEEYKKDLKEVFQKYNRAKDGTAVIENRFQLSLTTCA